jgi:hypothetical protein
MKKVLLALAGAACCLTLAGCGDGGVPAAKSVEAKPAPKEQVPAPGERFKGSFGSNDGAGAPADPKKPAPQ